MNIQDSAGFQKISDLISVEPHNLYFAIEEFDNDTGILVSIDIDDKETARKLAEALLQWADS